MLIIKRGYVMNRESPVYSHNPYDSTKFPLLVLDVENNRSTPANEGFQVFHWHDEIQLIYVLKGQVDIKVFDEDLKLERNDCIFINRNAIHKVMGSEDCHYHSYIIPRKILSFFPGSIMEKNNVDPIVNDPSITHYVLSKEMADNNHALAQIEILDKLYFQNTEGKQREYRISIQLCNIWLELSQLIPTSKSESTDVSYDRIRTLISTIHSNYNKNLSIQDIADSAHISKTECLRCFKKYMKETPYQYLMKYRLHVSTSLLTSTEMSVTDIALSVGFNSTSSFIKYFKNYYKTTPSAYRVDNDNYNPEL